MPSLIVILGGVGLLLLGVSHAIGTYLDWQDREATDAVAGFPSDASETTAVADSDNSNDATSTDTGESFQSDSVAARAVAEERVRAYREIMDEVIRLNRDAVELSDTELREEADLMAHGGDSSLDGQHATVVQTYQSYFHVISPEVKAAISDYADYLVTYHDEGAQIGELLSRSGNIAEAMREDFDLEPLFLNDSDAATEKDVSESQAPFDFEEDEDVEYPDNEELGTIRQKEQEPDESP